MMELLQNFTFDFWTLWGMVAQALFFSRFILQWYLSEKENKIVIPQSFWLLSISGACMIFVYALARKDLVFLITGVLQLALYSRNLMIGEKNDR